jgi:ribosomal protein S18 acetylase RimI-like enzyme
MTIRVASVPDAAAVARVHVESWKVAYRGIMPDAKIAQMDLATRTRFWAERLAVREWPVFVVEDRDQLIAFCHMTASRDPDADPTQVGEIASIHVLPNRTGTGLGRRLLDRAFAEFRKRGYREVTLWVLEGNASARRVYEKVGFRDDGGRKTYSETEVPEVRYRVRLSLLAPPATH